MKIYDTANRLAEEIKTSEEYQNYMMAKQAMALNPALKSKIQEFETQRYELQITAMQTGKQDQEKQQKLQELYAELIQIDEIKRYFDAELKFNIIFADVNKIIGEAVRELMQ